MNANIVCLVLGMIVLFFTTCFFIRESNEHIAELKKDLKEATECINHLRKVMLSMDDDLEQTKVTLNNELNDIKKLFSSEKSLDVESRLKGIEGSLKGMLDLMEQERTERINARYEEAVRQTKALYEANLASAHTGDDDKPYADIPGDLNEGFEGEEPATDEQREALEYSSLKVNEKTKYEWIFPSSDPSAVPIIGDEYLVIGRDRENNDIVTDVGTWKGPRFGLGLPGGFSMKEGYILDRVYAYVRLPSPSDVMNEVLDICFKE